MTEQYGCTSCIEEGYILSKSEYDHLVEATDRGVEKLKALLAKSADTDVG